MIAGYLLALREGLEAAVIVGLLLGALRQIRHPEMSRWVWFGVSLAAALSLLLGVGLVMTGTELQGPAEAVFEGFMFALAAAFLTWMLFWVRGLRGSGNLERGLRRAATTGQRWGVFMTAFVAVGREGLEMGFFLSAAALAADTRLAAIGGALGLATAALLGAVLYLGTLRLDLRMFFAATGVMLVLFAAGLVGRSIHEFNEIGWIPPVIAPLWDVSGRISTSSALGQAATVLFGFDPSPSLTQALAYVGYLVAVAGGFRLTRHIPQPLSQAH